MLLNTPMAYYNSDITTAKKRLLVKSMIEGKTVNEAAKIAGYNPSYASSILHKPKTKLKFIDHLNKAGLTDEHLCKRFNDLAHSTETKFFAKDGIVVDQREVPALETQRKSLEFVARLKGHLVEQVDHGLSEQMLDRLFVIPAKPGLDAWTPEMVEEDDPYLRDDDSNPIP